MAVYDDEFDKLVLGGGVKSWSWNVNPGTSIEGTILDRQVVHQRELVPTGPGKFEQGEPKYYDKEKTRPVLQPVLTLQTNVRDPQDPSDDGRRKVHLSSKATPKLATAVRNAGADTVREGGYIKITFTHTEPNKMGSGNPSKHFDIVYTPPGAAQFDQQVQQTAPPVQQAYSNIAQPGAGPAQYATQTVPVAQPVQYQPQVAQQPVQAPVQQAPVAVSGPDPVSDLLKNASPELLAAIQAMTGGQQ